MEMFLGNCGCSYRDFLRLGPHSLLSFGHVPCLLLLILAAGDIIVVAYVIIINYDCLCGLVVRVPGYRSRGPGSILSATRFYG
jgi:hypothetical protein